MARVSGYHYVTLKSGKRKRVYSRGVSKKAKGAVHTRRSGKPSRGPAYSSYPNDVIMGYGGYRFSGNRSGRNIREPGIPRVQNTTRGVIVRHKEFLTDVPSSIGFTSVTYPLNPGIDGSFPWLSRVAQNFEEWLPRGIIVEYRTTSSDTLLAANPALGSVIIATQYNSVNADFVNKQQMENYQGAISCKPSVSMIHQVETKRSQTQMDEFYIRTAVPPANADLRLYDLGKVQVATVGSQANGNIIGELWISYEVELRKPKIPTDPIVDAAHFILLAATLAGEAPASPFGNTTAQITAPTSGSTMPNARLIGGAASGTISFGDGARGLYMVVMKMEWGVGGTQGVWAFGALVNLTVVAAWTNNTATLNQETDAATATATSSNLAFIVNITGNGASLAVSSNSTATTPLNNDVYIIELPDSMN